MRTAVCLLPMNDIPANIRGNRSLCTRLTSPDDISLCVHYADKTWVDIYKPCALNCNRYCVGVWRRSGRLRRQPWWEFGLQSGRMGMSGLY
ncbi:unnamed protein product [Boreogadus saida]